MTFEVGRLSAALTLEGVDQANRGLDQFGAKFKQTGRDATVTSQGLAQSIKQAATNSPNELNLVGSAFTKVGVAAAAASAVAITKWANFDEAMSAVSAATHESADNMELLKQAALDAGARTVFSATEAAGAIEELAKAGVSTQDILSGGLDGALDLAAAGGLGVADAAGIAAVALKTFNLEGSQMGHVADLLAAGAGKAMGDVTDLSQALNQSAMVAKSSGLSIEETTAALAAFASQGLLGSDAGTSFKTMLMALQGPTGAAKAEMDKLGISAYDSQGKFVGLANFAGQLKTALSGMSEEQRQATLKTIFGSDAIRAATVLYSEGADGIREWEAAVNDQGYAAETAATRLDNLKGDIEALGGALDTAFIQTGSGANDALRSMVQFVTSAVDAYNALPAPVQSAALGIALLTAGVGLLGGALMKGAVQAAEFRAAMATLAPVGSAAHGKLSALMSLAGGPWGVALLAAAAATRVFNQAMESTQVSAETMTNSLKQGKSAYEEMLTAAEGGNAFSDFFLNNTETIKNFGDVLNNVAENGNNWWADMFTRTVGQNNAIADLENFGTALQQLASSDMPAAQSAFKQFYDEAGLNSKQALTALNDTMPGFKSSLIDAAKAAGLATDDATLLKLALGEVGTTAESSTSGTAAQVESLEELAGVAQSTGDNVEELSDQIKGFGSAAFDMEGAAIKLQEEYRGLAEALAAGGQSLDINTEAGGKTVQMLMDIASAANDSAGATLAMTGNQEHANAILAEARQKIIDARVALGDDPGAAAAWADRFVSSSQAVQDSMQQVADKVAAIPDEKKLMIDADTASAYAGIEGVQVLQIDDKTAYVIAETDEAMSEVQAVRDAQIPEKIAKVDADTAAALAGYEGVNVTPIDAKTAYVYGENSQAVAKINEVIGKGIPGKTSTVTANDSGFWNAWFAIQRAQMADKIVNIIEQVTRAPSGKQTGGIVGNFDEGGAIGFAGGGFPSGMYQGRVGGIWKPGADGRMHNFAEGQLGVPWEVYISGKPSFREQNISYALAALEKLAFPVVPLSALRGTRQFAEGGMVANRPGSRATDPRLLGADRNLNLKVSIEAHRGLDVDAIADLVTEKVIERVEEVL